MSEYPDGFFDWPLERRNEFFAEKARLHDEKQRRTRGGNGAPDRKGRPGPPRENLLLSAWVTRELPPRDFLLGNVFCRTSRWLIFGDTGVGKTLLALSIAGAMAAAKAFLGWEGKRLARLCHGNGSGLPFGG